MMNILSNQLDREWADRLIDPLNVLLCNFQVMHANASGIQRNGWGEQFLSLDQALNTYVEHCSDAAARIAQRILCLEGKPYCKLSEFLRYSTLNEADSSVGQRVAVRIIRDGFSEIIRMEREIITTAQHGGDEVTAHEITDLLKFQEESIWRMRAFLRRSAFEEVYRRESA
jgi:starvation-inducible DNA-binding protein